MAGEDTPEFVLYADTRKSLRGLNIRTLCIMLPLVLAMFAFFGALTHGLTLSTPRHFGPAASVSVSLSAPPALSALFSWFPWFLVAEVVVLYIIVRRATLNQKKPAVRLTPEGITVYSLGMQLGLIRWEEIAEIRAYTFIYRCVGIVLRDIGAVARRAKASSALVLRLNQFFIPLYQAFGIFVAPINIPQVYLSLSADELLARIKAYRAAYAQALPRQTALPGVWPPPPIRPDGLPS